MKKTKQVKPTLNVVGPPFPVSRILGLDISLNATGWAKSHDGQITSGIVDPHTLRGMERLQFVRDTIWEMAKEPGTLVLLEDVAGSKGWTNNASELIAVNYLVRFQLWQNKVPYLLIGTTQLKKFATGVGNAQKNVILKEVYKRWGLDVNCDDVADAFVLCKMGEALVHLPDTLPKFQVEVLKEVQKRCSVLETEHTIGSFRPAVSVPLSA